MANEAFRGYQEYYSPDIRASGSPVPESSPAKEAFQILFGGITISGRSGTGKTAVAELLAQRYGIRPERNIKTGQIFRQLLGDVVGFQERDPEVDRRLDNMQAELIKTSDLNDPFILEGRLAGVIASEQAQRAYSPVVRILFVAPKKIREERVLRRQREKNPNLTLEEVRRQTRERESGDFNVWWRLHPQLYELDPFNPGNKDLNGKPIYDLVVHTGNMSVDQVAEHIHKKLMQKGFIRPVESTSQRDFLSKGTIFEAH